GADLTSLRQGYGGPPKLQRRQKVRTMTDIGNARLEVRRRSGDRHDGNDEYEAPQERRNRSHKKTGPPMMAVMMPTGNSSGAMIVRATRSQPIRNAAPNSADAGKTRR